MNQQGKADAANLESNSRELQQMCQYDSDDNDEFFETLDYFEADNTSENTTAKSRLESERVNGRSNDLFLEENNETSYGCACAMTPKDSLIEEIQCIDIKCPIDTSKNESYYKSSDDHESARLYSMLSCSSEFAGSLPNTETVCGSSDDSYAHAQSGFVFLENESDSENIEAFPLQQVKRREESFIERSSSFADFCPKHCGHKLKYKCHSCDTVVCQVCVTVEHQQCDREFIPSLISQPDFYFENKYRAFEDEMDDIKKRLTLNKNKIKSNISSCERMRVKAKSNFTKQREEMNKLFDCIETDFDRNLWKIENTEKEKMQMLMLKQEQLENEYQQHTDDYYQRKESKKYAGMFTKIEMSRGDVEQMKKDLEAVEANNNVRRYVFKPSKIVTEFIESVSDLGIIAEVDAKMKRNVIDKTTINTRVDSDKKPCKISGLDFLSDNHLVAVDYGNSSVKVIDIGNDKVLLNVPMPLEPFDVTVARDPIRQQRQELSDCEIVLTLPKENKLRFMQFVAPDKFSVKFDGQTNGQCRGIAYTDDKLFITFPGKGKIEILNMQAQLLKRITTETVGQLFLPQFVTVNPDLGTLFISDKENHSVISMTLDGEFMDEYKHHDLIQPRGLCVSRTGALYVCSFASHMIHHLSEYCEGICTMSVADKEHPAPFPFSIAYSDTLHVLYVGQFTMDCIKAYKLE